MNYAAIADLVMGKLLSVHGDGDIHDHFTLDTWEWPQGVAMYAMMKVYLSDRDPEKLLQIKQWYDRHLPKKKHHNINTTAPMLALTYLYEETKDRRYLDAITEWASWIMESLPRTQEGGFQHITSDDENCQQIWDDTLYMTVLFLYRAGQVMQEPKYCQEAEYQFLLHIKYLQSQRNHLWYHGYCFDGGHHFGEAYWARGNSWFTAGGIDFVEWLPEGSTKRLVAETFVQQSKALKNCQNQENGLWHTLLDDPDSYCETSGSAAIAYGLLKGIRLGVLPRAEFEACAEKAVKGVLDMIDADGVVQGVSYGTPMGKNKDFYRHVPIEPTAYGQGLVFLMLTELMQKK